MVDLESCPYLKEEPMAPFEYVEVCSVDRETSECVAIGYEGYWVGYPVDTVLLVRDAA